MSNHLLVQLQRQHILLSYFKTLSVGPVWGSNPRPPAQQTGALRTLSQLNEEYFFFPNFSQQLAKSCSVHKLHTSNLCK